MSQPCLNQNLSPEAGIPCSSHSRLSAAASVSPGLCSGVMPSGCPLGRNDPGQGGPGEAPGLGAAFAWAEASTLRPVGELQGWGGSAPPGEGLSCPPLHPAGPCTPGKHLPGGALPPTAFLASAWRRDNVRAVRVGGYRDSCDRGGPQSSTLCPRHL